MGACRESQNIFQRIKNKNYKGAWYLIRHFNKLTYEDTFMPIICKMKGHIYYLPDASNEPNDWACKRCHRFVKYNPRLEKLKQLKKISKKNGLDSNNN